jgi:beta-glucosidase
MLTFENFKTVEDTESAFAQQNLRFAIHNILYTVANSNAVNGIAPGASLTYNPAAWEIWVQILTIALWVLVAAGIAWILVRTLRNRNRPQDVDAESAA